MLKNTFINMSNKKHTGMLDVVTKNIMEMSNAKMKDNTLEYCDIQN